MDLRTDGERVVQLLDQLHGQLVEHTPSLGRHLRLDQDGLQGDIVVAFCHGDVSVYNTGSRESVLKEKVIKKNNRAWSRCSTKPKINDNTEIEQSHRNLHLQNRVCVKKTLLRCDYNNSIFDSLFSLVNLNRGKNLWLSR